MNDVNFIASKITELWKLRKFYVNKSRQRIFE